MPFFEIMLYYCFSKSYNEITVKKEKGNTGVEVLDNAETYPAIFRRLGKRKYKGSVNRCTPFVAAGNITYG